MITQLGRVTLNRLEMHSRSGCLSKLPPCELEDLLTPLILHSRCPGSTETPLRLGDDCRVINACGTEFLISTDFGPLVGIDMYDAGRIAALHAMSDVFACGGLPQWATAILILSPEHVRSVGEAVLSGVMDVCACEGASLIGGHTLLGKESIAGMTVIGTPQHDCILTTAGARQGDQLLLSKPVGVGLVVRAYKLGLVGDKTLSEAVDVMCISNRTASLAATEAGVSCATDVTGFGLLGHLVHLLGDHLGATLWTDSIPKMCSLNSFEPLPTFWSEGNHDYVLSKKSVRTNLPRCHLLPLLDPQTNGGLLVAADATRTERLVSSGFTWIGTVEESRAIIIK